MLGYIAEATYMNTETTSSTGKDATRRTPPASPPAKRRGLYNYSGYDDFGAAIPLCFAKKNKITPPCLDLSSVASARRRKLVLSSFSEGGCLVAATPPSVISFFRGAEHGPS